jgi:hypothetical protein
MSAKPPVTTISNPFAKVVLLMSSNPTTPEGLDQVVAKGDARIDQETVVRLTPLADAKISPRLAERLDPIVQRLCLRILDQVIYPALLDEDPYGLKPCLREFIARERVGPYYPDQETSDAAMVHAAMSFHRLAMQGVDEIWNMRELVDEVNPADIRKALATYSAGMAAMFYAESGEKRQLFNMIGGAADVIGLQRAHADGTLSMASAKIGNNETPISEAIVLSKLAQFMLDDPGLALMAADPALFEKTLAELSDGAAETASVELEIAELADPASTAHEALHRQTIRVYMVRDRSKRRNWVLDGDLPHQQEELRQAFTVEAKLSGFDPNPDQNLVQTMDLFGKNHAEWMAEPKSKDEIGFIWEARLTQSDVTLLLAETRVHQRFAKTVEKSVERTLVQGESSSVAPPRRPRP